MRIHIRGCVFSLLMVVLFTSCKTENELTKRKYTQGNYREFNLHREKAEKNVPVDSAATEKLLPLLVKMKEEVLPSLQELNSKSFDTNPKEIFHERYPVIAEKIDSAIDRSVVADTSWMADTAMPECVEAAFATQAMLGVGVVSGMLTIAAPEFIWVSFIFLIAAPLMLLISLVAAAIALTKISTGEIDAKYKRAMRLWALCMLVNLCLGTLVLMYFTS